MATINVKDAAGSTVALEKPLAPGSVADAASRPVAWSTEGKAQMGALGETAPVTDTASSGLNGRLQRIAQRITSMIALLPAALGAGGGLKVDGSGTALPVSVPTDPFGANADAASVSGSISAKLRAIATALGSTAFDLGIGTGGSRTLRVAVDTSQADGSEYETVPVSTTAQVLGSTGATGDYISGILIVPTTVDAGNVLLLDNATSITVFAGGTASLSNKAPFFVPLGMKSVSGAWKITTGTNVTCIAVGDFT